MKIIKEAIGRAVVDILSSDFGVEVDMPALQITRKEFDGQFTLVVFPYTKPTKMAPPLLGEAIGKALQERLEVIESFNVVKGFLNLSLVPDYWLERMESLASGKERAKADVTRHMVVEYSSPNTNKPLHLGHIRNNLLGHSVSEILKAVGHQVNKVQIINDRGIHICKSMYAWILEGEKKSPETTGLKGDKLVGNYYVAFDKLYKSEIHELVEAGMEEAQAKKEAASIKGAQDLLRKWEAGDKTTIDLWEKMNGWVYDGFDTTYASLGITFDKNYYESNTYLLGKDVIEKGLKDGVFYRKEDGSVWIDLSEDGLDEKLLLRGDGTAVYMTQDIGTAIQRYEDFQLDGMVYTVGNEQEYHFKVLFLILKKLGYDWAERLYHLSYGMVNLPSGKMKSREGTVVDADDLIEGMQDSAQEISEELGKTEGMELDARMKLYKQVGLGALKYFILKVDPSKNMLFDPKESIDFNGNTGPFIQYTHARIRSLQRKAKKVGLNMDKIASPGKEEIALISLLDQYDEVLLQSAELYNPALVANYVYDLTKTYNSWYQNHTVLNNEDESISALRLQLSAQIADRIAEVMHLLGIECPNQM
jgi:arginyl-tRNA synthetase